MRLTAIALLALASPLYAAEHFVSPGQKSFDCSGVAPGDTITFDGGVYELSPLFALSDCQGTADRPIRIRNNPKSRSRVEFRKVSTNADNFVWRLKNVRHVVVDGTEKWIGAPSGKTYGFLVTTTSGRSPSVYMMVNGSSTDLTVRGVEIDGNGAKGGPGIGIHLNDPEINDPGYPSNYPSQFRENIVLEDNYLHDLLDLGEGFYIGPNWATVSSQVDDVRLRNVTIRNNLVEDTGRDGIQLKSSVAGTNRIYGNIVRRTGLGPDDRPTGQRHGISVYEGCADVYDNVVEDAGERGIELYAQTVPSTLGPCKAVVRGNTIVNPGRTGPLPGVGIQIGRYGTSIMDYDVTIESNLVKYAPSNAVNVNSHVAQRGTIRSNTFCESGDVVPGSYSETETLIACPSSSAAASSEPFPPEGLSVLE